MRKSRIISCLILSLLLWAPLYSTDILTRVRQKIQQIRPFKVAFTQQIVNEGEIEIEEHGELTFKHQSLIKWVYQKPDYKVFLLKDNEYRFYDHDYEQLTIGRVQDKKKEWIWRLLFDPDIGPRMEYDPKNARLIIRDLVEGMQVEIFINQDLLPVKILQVDPFGYTRVTLFAAYQKRVNLEKDEFLLKVGKNVDIVRLD